MPVPVIDKRGIPLEPTAPARARRLIREGKAVPHRDRDGLFYLQLTYEPERTNGDAQSDTQDRDYALLAAATNPAYTRRLSRKRLRKFLREFHESILNTMAQPRQESTVAGKLDRLIVIDIEATCWDHEPPDGQEAEIIEIGVCELDLCTGDRLSKQSILVRPERSLVSPFCTELTTLTQADVDSGVSFAEACQMLHQHYQTRDRVWASYGDYDRRQFEKQCAARDIGYPFGPTHVNVKNLLALVKGLRREVSMAHALELLDLPLEGTHHRGHDDAWNTALIASTIIMQRRAELEL